MLWSMSYISHLIGPAPCRCNPGNSQEFNSNVSRFMVLRQNQGKLKQKTALLLRDAKSNQEYNCTDSIQKFNNA